MSSLRCKNRQNENIQFDTDLEDPLTPSDIPPPSARLRSGQLIEPGQGVVPILKEIGKLQLKVVGTGFYITRYGLVATAKHVIEDLSGEQPGTLGMCFVAHLGPNQTVFLRRLHRAHMLINADVAIVQADNYSGRPNTAPLANVRASLSPTIPEIGARLVTYAYPENKILDFTLAVPPTIRSDYYVGSLRRFVAKPEYPLLNFSYLESTVNVQKRCQRRSGI